MGYMGTNLLTSGEHDFLWREAFQAIPGIVTSLRRSNAIECVKALHDDGIMTDEEFLAHIAYILKAEGFTWISDSLEK